MIINSCKKHGNSSYEYRLSNRIIKYINDDIPIHDHDIVKIQFRFNEKVDTFLLHKEEFIQNKLLKEYVVDSELYENKQLEEFSNQYLGVICVLCVRDYEIKHNISLTKDLIRPYTMF